MFSLVRDLLGAKHRKSRRRRETAVMEIREEIKEEGRGKDAGVTIHQSVGSCLRESPAVPPLHPGERR